MRDPHNPQFEQMADESMVRNLDAQARAIWPQEVALFPRYGLREDAAVLDVGCGTGEITRRLAERFPRASLLGVDLIEAHLARAEARCRDLGDRVRFRVGNAFDLPFESDRFDLVVCRHLLQAVPRPELALAEMVRVARGGGRLHLIAEDYGMIHLHPVGPDAAAFFSVGPPAFGAATGTDLHVGRRAYTLLLGLGLADVTVDYVVVDTTRVPRDTFAAIFEAWRDGYAEPVAEHTGMTPDRVRATFDDMIACMRRPDGYAVWQVPVVSGRKP
jgi:ubiquinone/menaquinone biosynthesis C-methylase UbiE